MSDAQTSRGERSSCLGMPPSEVPARVTREPAQHTRRYVCDPEAPTELLSDAHAVAIESRSLCSSSAIAVLLSSCRRAVRDADMARDAAQQAVLTAMLGLHRLRDEDRFAAWLIGIVQNVCRTFIAAQARTVPCPELVNDHARALALAGLTHAEIAEELSTRSGADADLDWCDGGHSLCRDPRKRRASRDPGPHHFAAALLGAAGGEVPEVRIVRLTDSIFFAQAVLADGTRRRCPTKRRADPRIADRFTDLRRRGRA